MKNKTQVSAVLAAVMMMSLTYGAGSAGASDNIRIIGESETQTEAQTETQTGTLSSSQAGTLSQGAASMASAPKTGEENSGPLNPADKGITAQDAVEGVRALYSQMQHYADINDNAQFETLFEDGADEKTLQAQLQAVKSSLSQTKDLTSHSDLCFVDPTKDSTKSPYYFSIGLTDYKVNDDGSVVWYSTLLRAAKYEDGWKAALLSSDDLVQENYPEGFTSAKVSGRNATDLYPYLAMRFADGAVFDGAFYSLVNMVWQNEDGSVSFALWLANGTESSKWCDSIDCVIKGSDSGTIASVNVPVQAALEGGESSLVTCTIPADSVKTDTEGWGTVTVQSNLLYQ